MMDVIHNSTPVWTSVNVILDVIFQNVSMKDLNSCAQVCKLWNDVAQRVKKRRNQITWFFYAAENDNRSCKTAFAEFLENLLIQPRLAIIYRTPLPLDRFCEKVFHPYTESLELLEYLPLSCVTFISEVPSISATTSGHRETEKTDFYNSCEALIAVFFPFFPGVQIHTFQLLKREILFHDTSDNLTGIFDNEKLKCLFLFMYGLLETNVGLTLLEKVLDLEERDGISLVTNSNEVSFMKRNILIERGKFGIAFIGENVSSMSIHLHATASAAIVDEQLQKFVDVYKSEDQCLAFAFTYFHQKREFLNPQGHYDAFRKLFSTVPLFTIFQKPGHSDSTVFLMLTVKSSS